MILDLCEIWACPECYTNKTVTLQGWIRNHRKQKKCGFISFFDGTVSAELQIVYDAELEDFAVIQGYHIGSAITVVGKIVDSQGSTQQCELQATRIVLEGASTESYPLQPKKHSLEYLREIAHLRPRTRVMQAVFRIRSISAYAIHKYFHSKKYVYVHTPLITANDGEGAGETFQVTTLDIGQTPDYTADFFGKKACLAVTGQLEGEAFAMAYKKIYTFGPTFRAENSNTKTHASEFWMIEPEIAFCDINQLMDIEEDFLKYVVKYVTLKAEKELEFLDKFTGKGIINRLNELLKSEVKRITHEEAINILQQSGKQWDYAPKHGKDLAREHEKYLTEEYFNSPVFVYNWPKDIKAFYMRQNEDGKTVSAVDLLVPSAGELMGGSQREEREDMLLSRMQAMHIPTDDLYWYTELRKYGGCKHSGFGMGFERLIIYLTGIDNIRDVIPFPRTPKNCQF